MFRADTLPEFPIEPNVAGFFKRPRVGAVDAESGAWLRPIIGRRGNEYFAWCLFVRGQLIPFDIYETLVADPADPHWDVRLEPDHFGESFIIGRTVDIPPVRFADEQERDRLAMLAVEGLLVDFGSRKYAVEVRPQVAAFGKIWKLQDFGY